MKQKIYDHFLATTFFHLATEKNCQSPIGTCIKQLISDPATGNSQPMGWETTATETIILQTLLDKVLDVESKVAQIIDYMGIDKKTKRNHHATAVTITGAMFIANNQLRAAKTTVKHCGSSYKIPPTVRQRAVCVSTSKGNLAKNLLLEIFSPGE